MNIEKKISYLLLILNKIKGFDNHVDKLIVSLQNGNIQNSLELDKIYNLTIDSIKESNEQYNNKKIDEFKKNKEFILFLKEKEKQERLEEGKTLNINL